MTKNRGPDTLGIDPQLLQLIRRLNWEQQLELKGYLKRLITQTITQKAPRAKILLFDSNRRKQEARQ